jgi:hypothetical protein
MAGLPCGGGGAPTLRMFSDPNLTTHHSPLTISPAQITSQASASRGYGGSWAHLPGSGSPGAVWHLRPAPPRGSSERLRRVTQPPRIHWVPAAAGPSLRPPPRTNRDASRWRPSMRRGERSMTRLLRPGISPSAVNVVPAPHARHSREREARQRESSNNLEGAESAAGFPLCAALGGNDDIDGLTRCRGPQRSASARHARHTS